MTFCHHGVGDALDTPELRAIAVTDWFDAVDHLKQTVALDNSDFYTLHHSRTRPLPPSRPGIGFPPFPFASSNQPSLLVSQTRPDSVTPLPLFCPRLTYYPSAISLPAKKCCHARTSVMPSHTGKSTSTSRAYIPTPRCRTLEGTGLRNIHEIGHVTMQGPN